MGSRGARARPPASSRPVAGTRARIADDSALTTWYPAWRDLGRARGGRTDRPTDMGAAGRKGEGIHVKFDWVGLRKKGRWDCSELQKWDGASRSRQGRRAGDPKALLNKCVCIFQ